MRVTIIVSGKCRMRKTQRQAGFDPPKDRGTYSWSLARDGSRDLRSMDPLYNGPSSNTATYIYNDRKLSETSLVFISPVQTYSQMSVPSSPTHFSPQDGDATLHSLALPRTRTVAIVKNHAFPHRLDIEPRISEAGFEVCEITPRQNA